MTSIPIDALAFAFYVRNFVFQPNDLPDFGLDYTAFVLQQWALTQPGSGLHFGIQAVSHALFGCEKKLQKALDQARIYHAQSVAKMQQEMQELSAEGINPLLVTAMLLDTYEVSLRC